MQDRKSSYCSAVSALRPQIIMYASIRSLDRTESMRDRSLAKFVGVICVCGRAAIGTIAVVCVRAFGEGGTSGSS